MAHHQPKWRASRAAPGPLGSIKLAAAAFNLHPAAARRDRSIAVNLNTDCNAPGDKIDTVLAPALREGGQHIPAQHREKLRNHAPPARTTILTAQLRPDQPLESELPTLRILLAEDVAMVRGALVALIELEPDFKVVASIRNGSDIVPTALACQPDVSIIDIDLPGLDGLSAAAQLHEALPACRTLILTNLSRAGTIRRAFTARVSGYLLKDAPPEELANAIRNIAAGGKVIDPQLAVTAWDDRQNPLSAREHEVLRLTAAGADPAEIATIMHLSIGTVRNYLTTIVTKLNARTRVDAVKSAYDAGWLP